MRHIAPVIIAFCLAVAPVSAQEQPDAETEDGFSLMEEGARMLLRGLMSEMEPAITDLREGLEDMGPALAELAQTFGPAFAAFLNEVDDFRNYSAPEFLPNGDIIIRRTPDAPE